MLSFGWNLVRLRRFRREGYQLVLDEIAASAGWSGTRCVWHQLGVTGDWMGRTVSLSVSRSYSSSSDSTWEYLLVRIDGATRAKRMDIGCGPGGTRPPWWQDISFSLRHLELRDPELERAFEVTSRDRPVAEWLFADPGLVGALRKSVAASDGLTRVNVRPHHVAIHTALPGSLSFEVTPALLGRLTREHWALAVLLVRRLALRPR